MRYLLLVLFCLLFSPGCERLNHALLPPLECEGIIRCYNGCNQYVVNPTECKKQCHTDGTEAARDEIDNIDLCTNVTCKSDKECFMEQCSQMMAHCLHVH